MSISHKKAWRQYEAGKEYKRRMGLYETVRNNEQFYRGDQWSGMANRDLPKPVFNILKRVSDYLVCSVASADLQIRFTNEDIPFAESESSVRRYPFYAAEEKGLKTAKRENQIL